MKSNKRDCMNAPCSTSLWDKEKREFEQNYPSVNCRFNCWNCGFNPEEQARRLTTGRFDEHVVSHDLHNDDGDVVHTITRKVKTLHYIKEANNA